MLGHPPGQLVGDPADGDHRGQRHAAFAGGTEGGRGDVLGGVVEVRVGHHDGVVVRPTEGLDPLAVPGRGLLDDPGHRGGADERDRVDPGVLEQRGDHVPVAGDDVEDAVGQAGLPVQAGDDHRGGRRRGRRLQHEGVAGGDGDRVHPHRHHHREVERADAGDDADRLAQGVDVHAGRDVVGDLTLQGRGNVAGEVEGLPAALDLTDGVGEGLAVLVHDGGGQLVLMVEDQLAHPEHDVHPLGQRHLAPAELGPAGHPDGVVDVGHRGLEQLGLDPAGRGVLDRDPADGLTVVRGAVDPLFDRLHGLLLLVAGVQLR
ncbi:hypothetical protein SDC9_131928 [bioreactor metagenome]|uniref:Uncharacterized protein n=1 Tax=bioreactor metagenome TaxID=1076179 RepID=A0A645D8C4_9ZZZZ